MYLFEIISYNLFQLPEFPLFLNVGQVNVNIIVNHTVIQFTEKEMLHLEEFHKVLFTDALPVLKKYCERNDVNFQLDDYIIAPVVLC